jgi:hypothetical protein
MWEDFCQWFSKAPEAKEYQHLNFEGELTEARSGNSGKSSTEKQTEDTRW